VETDLGVQAIWEGRIFCHLRVLLAEQEVVAALVASRFAQAAELLQGLTALLGRFPSLLAEFVPSTQMLLGGWGGMLAWPCRLAATVVGPQLLPCCLQCQGSKWSLTQRALTTARIPGALQATTRTACSSTRRLPPTSKRYC
jgi:hypothetical protein